MQRINNIETFFEELNLGDLNETRLLNYARNADCIGVFLSGKRPYPFCDGRVSCHTVIPCVWIQLQRRQIRNARCYPVPAGNCMGGYDGDKRCVMHAGNVRNVPIVPLLRLVYGYA